MGDTPEVGSPDDLALRKRLLERVKSDPDGYEANRDFALYCVDKRNFRLLAEPYLLKALSHNRMDDYTVAMTAQLAAIFQTTGRFEMAARSFDLLRQLAPHNVDFLKERGNVSHRMGRIDEASDLYRLNEEILAARARQTAKRLGEPVRRLIGPAAAMCAYIGELATLSDYLVKTRALGWLDDFEPILLAEPEHVVNPCFLDYWRAHYTVVTDPAEITEYREKYGNAPLDLNNLPVGGGRILNRDIGYPIVQNLWDGARRPPLLSLAAEHRERGNQRLRELGMPEKAWFAALHVREQGHKREDPRLGHNRMRCADIQTYFPAIEEITRRGGWVVRLGDPSMTPLPPMSHVIDYAQAETRHDWMDVFLMAGCRLFVGMATGPWDVARVFGVPIVATNWFPPGGWPYAGNVLFVPKLLRETATGKLLTWQRMTTPPLYAASSSHIFSAHGLEPVDNTEEELREAVAEKLDRMNGEFAETDEGCRLETQFHVCDDQFGIGGRARVAHSFLARHPELVETEVRQGGKP